MNIEVDVQDCRFVAAGLLVRYSAPVLFGGKHHRYTLYQHDPRGFVAWFCWYEKPAVEREFNPKPREVGVISGITKADLSQEVTILAEEWLDGLKLRHPVC